MMNTERHRVRVIDSHTGGEPTRVIVSGGPNLGSGSLQERFDRFQKQHDDFRSAVVNEPRGSEVMVGALLCEPSDPKCVAGVMFFNNVGYLGMCGHGTIGLVATLSHIGRIGLGAHQIETPVGVVEAWLDDGGDVTVRNVASYRSAANVTVDVPGYGKVCGDVAWGGNWFFLVHEHRQELTVNRIEDLTAFSWAIRHALRDQGITGAGGAEVDHIELFCRSQLPDANSKNFVLCPGKAYDRSPCGTGTSAKLACLHADGKIREGEIWRQEGILGTVFEATIAVRDGKVFPSIRGSAYVTSEAELVFDPDDPFRMGIRG